MKYTTREFRIDTNQQQVEIFKDVTVDRVVRAYIKLQYRFKLYWLLLPKDLPTEKGDSLLLAGRVLPMNIDTVYRGY